MSADNYYLIRLHPLGGYALINASASDDRKPRARKGHERFDTVDEALAAASKGYYEYGGSVDPECEWEPPMVREVDKLRTLLTDLVNEVADYALHAGPFPDKSFIAARDYAMDQLHAYKPNGR